VPGLFIQLSHQAQILRAKIVVFPALGNLPILCTAYRKVNFSRSHRLRISAARNERLW
jgi:hypothetical protein